MTAWNPSPRIREIQLATFSASILENASSSTTSINIFIPPEHAGKEEMEEARKNMDKYADYRTYLSFDMQQIVRGDKDMTIGDGSSATG